MRPAINSPPACLPRLSVPEKRLTGRAGGTANTLRVGASTGVDPSALMLEIATARVEELGFSEGVSLQLGYVPLERSTAIGILHDLPGEERNVRFFAP